MSELTDSREIEAALRAVGELVEAAGEYYAIVIVGGAALNLLGIVERSTRDVDILAFAKPTTTSSYPQNHCQRHLVGQSAPLVAILTFLKNG
jgi:hypothetical protein